MILQVSFIEILLSYPALVLLGRLLRLLLRDNKLALLEVPCLTDCSAKAWVLVGGLRESKGTEVNMK